MIILKTTKSSIEIVKQMVKEMNDFEFRAYTPECHFYYNLLCDELSFKEIFIKLNYAIFDLYFDK